MFEIYDYTYDPNSKTYSFTTKHGVVIKLLIARDRSWFPDNPEITDVFTFDLEASPKSTALDFKIRNTVVHILSSLFENRNVVITYFCDFEDGKEEKRHNTFDRWHKAMNDETIHKHDRQVICQEKLIYSSILIHRDNQRYNRVITLYQAGDVDVTAKFFIT